MNQKFSGEVAVNATVNTLEFFQWYTGLNNREDIEEFMYGQDVVWEQGYDGQPISREELVKFLDNEQITINSYYKTAQDTGLTINNDYSVIIAGECPFIPALNY